MVRCKTLEESIRHHGVNSDERDKIRWGINNPNHKVLEFK